MATSFDRGIGGGPPDLRRLLTNPWVLGTAAVSLVLGIFIWRQVSGNAATAAGSQVPASSGLPGSNVTSTDQLGLQQGGLQDQLSNLAQQLTAVQGQRGGTIPPAGFSTVVGQEAGVDPGTYFGPPPASGAVPPGDVVAWRWTSTYAGQHPELGAGWALGNGPPPGQPAPQFSWEWAVLPFSQLQGGSR